MRVVIVLALLVGCLQPSASQCPSGGVCPAGFACLDLENTVVCVPASCGDGVLDPGEDCDDGNRLDHDDCSAECQHLCGNGFVDRGEVCDVGAIPVLAPCTDDCRSSCGDRAIDGDEECDDGNLLDGDGCGSSCRIERCGNSMTEVRRGETCDDGNLRSQDGCSSACQIETPRWWTTDERPVPVTNYAMAYDATRGLTVLFGGRNEDNGFAPETWLWDGARWAHADLAFTDDSPSLRWGASMVYDAARQVILLFGGCADYACHTTLNDLWEWNGVRWRKRVPASAPPPRAFSAMAYDAQNAELVLFGGYTYGTTGSTLADTWTWNGVLWTQRLVTGPAARAQHAMTNDPIRGRVVLVGGIDLAAPFADTWLWDGASWTQAMAAGAPARFLAGFAFVPKSGHAVLFGGCSDTYGPALRLPGACLGSRTEAWAWTGSAWISQPPLPYVNATMAAAIDRTGGLVCAHGSGRILDPETFVLDQSWVKRSPAPHPDQATLASSIAYDPLRALVVGFANGAAWEWNGAWTPRATHVSGPRTEPALAYDANRKAVLVVGGTSVADPLSPVAQLEWTGTWTALAPTAPGIVHLFFDAAKSTLFRFGRLGFETATTYHRTPALDWWSASDHHTDTADVGLAYDTQRHVSVSYGGSLAGTATGQMWSFDGYDWTDSNPVVSPGALASPALANDPVAEHLVLFGGRSADGVASNRTWDWAGAWGTLPSQTLTGFPLAPPPRQKAGMVYDAARRELVMFGGTTADVSTNFEDTWVYRYSSREPAEWCARGIDGDGDGRVGCDDPDCAGYCDPLCAANQPCTDPTRPRCGDGVCSEPEDGERCPADCEPVVLCGDFRCDPGEQCPGDCH